MASPIFIKVLVVVDPCNQPSYYKHHKTFLIIQSTEYIISLQTINYLVRDDLSKVGPFERSRP